MPTRALRLLAFGPMTPTVFREDLSRGSRPPSFFSSTMLLAAASLFRACMELLSTAL